MSLWTKYSRLMRFALFFSPSLFAAVYFGLIAADRYICEVQFVIRTASKPVGASGFGTFLEMAGLGRSPDDVYSVQTFFDSRDAIRQLSEILPIREFYGAPEADFLSRFPSVVYGGSLDEMREYLRWMISANYASNSGVSTLKVQAFRADDAKRVAAALLDLGEKTINRMNERIQAEAVKLAEFQTKRCEERLVQAQIALTRFRNKELTINPSSSSLIVNALISGLSEELSQVETNLRETLTVSPDSPTVPAQERRIEALKKQIFAERQRIANDNEGIAQKIAEFERLNTEREYAERELGVAEHALESARIDARRQQLYLQRIVEPTAPEVALAPERARLMLTVLGANLFLLLVGWLIWAGISERLAEKVNG